MESRKSVLTLPRLTKFLPGDRLRFTELREVWWSRALRCLGAPMRPVERERWVTARVVSQQGSEVEIER